MTVAKNHQKSFLLQVAYYQWKETSSLPDGLQYLEDTIAAQARCHYLLTEKQNLLDDAAWFKYIFNHKLNAFVRRPTRNL